MHFSIASPADLSAEKVKAIAAPDSKATVYVRVAKVWLNEQSATVREGLEKKWLEVGHVPQVIAYVLRGEVDAGFVNVVARNKNKDALVDGAEKSPAVESYLNCLGSEKSKAIFAKFGVKP